MNSPQSQKLAVPSRVKMNTVQAMAQTTQPDIVLTFLKFMREITKDNDIARTIFQAAAKARSSEP
jgi:hypothetical protein